MKNTGIPVTSPAMVWALAPAWSTRWKNRMATYAVDPTPDQNRSDPPMSTLALGPDMMSRSSSSVGRARTERSASAPYEALGASRTISSTTMPTATRITAATWKGRFQVDGSFCFHEAITVPLMVQLAMVPSTVVRRSALIQRLRPKTSGTTATLVRVKVADA